MKSRSFSWAALLLVLGGGPAWAFENEVDFGPIHNTHGHCELTVDAAKGTPYEAMALALVQGQWEQDFPAARVPTHLGEIPSINLVDLWGALVFGMEGDEQRKHFLRYWSGLPSWRSTTHSFFHDWQDAVDYFKGELRLARNGSPEGLRHLGHALHALQDSYSPAHVHRDALGRILTMGYYPGRGSEGHALVGEVRDHVLDASGSLVPEAIAARDASHALLRGFHEASLADEASFERYLDTFARQDLPLADPIAARAR